MLPLALHCQLTNLWDTRLGKVCVLIHGRKWPTDSSMVDNVVSNTVVGQYIKMLCLFLTSPPDFPLYRVERRVLNPTLTVSEAINISLLSLSHSLPLSFKNLPLSFQHIAAHANTQLILLDTEPSCML